MDASTTDNPTFPNTVATRLHRALRVRLCEGDFSPGEVVSIRRIAAEYGTSAMPAREAVRWLVGEGALRFSGARKIIVPQLNRAHFYEVLFARKSLETEVSRRAFPNIGSDDIDKLKEIDGHLNTAIAESDLSSYMHRNYQFHFHIYQLSQSHVLLSLIEMLWLQYGPSMRFICQRWGASSIADDYHRKATQALVDGDCDCFCQAIAADIEQGMLLLD